MPITAKPGTPENVKSVVIKSTDKLKFEISTDSPAPIFSFSVDGVLEWEPQSAPKKKSGGKTVFGWEFPTIPFKPVNATAIGVVIIGDEEYRYTIKKVGDGGTSLVLDYVFSGPEPVEQAVLLIGVIS